MWLLSVVIYVDFLSFEFIIWLMLVNYTLSSQHLYFQSFFYGAATNGAGVVVVVEVVVMVVVVVVTCVDGGGVE